MKIHLPNNKYIIYEKDILDILIAFNSGNYEWVLDFFESLNPIDNTDDQKSYTFEQILANAEITSYLGK
tara:strand:- start:147 stop:353 length:207 start_codon:yes stop_codon:yes gene_type:complete